MTVGIYALIFDGCEGVYIGQSSNIEYRFRQHIYHFNSAHYNHKLREAHTKYGLPRLEILCTCLFSELDALENFYIKEFDSVTNGFNIKDSSGVIARGPDHVNSLYSRDSIILVANLLVEEPPLLYSEIHEKSGVSIYTIENIASLKSHSWLKEYLPEVYSKMTALKGRRPGRKNKKYPNIVGPDGTIYGINNAAEFAKKHNLNRSHLISVLNGKRLSHKGWRKVGVS